MHSAFIKTSYPLGIFSFLVPHWPLECIILSFSPKNFIITNDSFSGIIYVSPCVLSFFQWASVLQSTQLLQFTTFFFFWKSNDLSHKMSISKRTTLILHFELPCSLSPSLSFPICYFINLCTEYSRYLHILAFLVP